MTKIRGGSSSVHPIQQIFNEMVSIDSENFQKAVSDPRNNLQVVNCLQLMNQITLADLGITERMVSSLKESVCMEVASVYNSSDDRGFTIAAFLMPAGCSLPIHDHPNMTVCSKLLCGSLEVLSLTPDRSSPSELVAWEERLEAVGPEDEAWLLTPSEGNIHRFSALSACVVLDVLLPPYREPARPCSYFAPVSVEAPPYSMAAQDGSSSISSSSSSSSSSSMRRKWVLRPLTAKEQAAVALPFGVRYRGFRPTHHGRM